MNITDISDDQIELVAMNVVGELLDTFGSELTHAILAIGYEAVTAGLQKNEFTDADRVEILTRAARLTERVRTTCQGYLQRRGDWTPPA